jgi:hypothetical protein
MLPPFTESVIDDAVGRGETMTQAQDSPGAGNAQVRNLTIAAAELDISGRRITIPEDLPSTWWAEAPGAPG